VQASTAVAAGKAAAVTVHRLQELVQREARVALAPAEVVPGQVAGREGTQPLMAGKHRQYSAQGARREQLPVREPSPAGQGVDLDRQRGAAAATCRRPLLRPVVQEVSRQPQEPVRQRGGRRRTRRRGLFRGRTGRRRRLGGGSRFWRRPSSCALSRSRGRSGSRGGRRRWPGGCGLHSGCHLAFVVEVGAGRLQRREQDRALLRRHAEGQDEGAVLVVRQTCAQAPGSQLGVGAVLLGPAGPPHPARQPLDLRPRAVSGAVEIGLLVGGARDPGDGADLRPGDAAGAERVRRERQPLQRVGDPHPLVRRGQPHAEPPGQPVRARQQTRAGPGLPSVELSDQGQHLGLSGGDPSGPGRDLLGQLVIGQCLEVSHGPMVTAGYDVQAGRPQAAGGRPAAAGSALWPAGTVSGGTARGVDRRADRARW